VGEDVGEELTRMRRRKEVPVTVPVSGVGGSLVQYWSEGMGCFQSRRMSRYVTSDGSEEVKEKYLTTILKQSVGLNWKRD